MNAMLAASGGLGLFLLGMSVMTDGLRVLADDRLRRFLSRSTNSPLGGAITGAISTALVQSSSATTVAAIGFVSAGLLTFPQSLGILFGANIGTTITGWLVALVGFKLKLGELLLPLILVGVMLKLFGRHRLRGIGSAAAGFGLIFVGITTLQDGMAAFADVVTPESFPPDTPFGRLLLVLIGLAITIVTQSSSAGVAMALTAVSVGSISLAQAAAMVIGMDVGTTVTALLATIGGTVQARRTGYSHVIYNLITGVGAFLLLTPYLLTLDWIDPDLVVSDPEIALVGFHTFFNTMGVVAVLPLTNQFAALITRLVPEQGNPLTRRLEQRLIGTPDLAIAAVQATVTDLVGDVFATAATLMKETTAQPAAVDPDIEEAIQSSQTYLSQVMVPPAKQALFEQKQGLIHVLDHLGRLLTRLGETARIQSIHKVPALQDQAERLANTCQRFAQPGWPDDAQALAELHRDYHRQKQVEKQIRREAIAMAARGEQSTETAIQITNAARMLRRIGYHVWRIIRQSQSNHVAATSASEPAGQ